MGHLGEIALIVSQIISWYGVVWFKNRSDFLAFSARLAFVMMSLSLTALIYGFLIHDFDLVYVTSHSHSLLPWYYRIAALWGGHEGSYLLWLWLIYLWAVLTFSFSDHTLSTRALWYALLIAALMGAYLLFLSSPFTLFVPAGPDDGMDLNPLLQDPLMMIHPPILYIGYVGFMIPMCYVLAYFHERQSVDLDLLMLKQVVTRVVFWLTLGIFLGSWWAYRELGWGGFWFWDPVENASLMPWLLGVALIHLLRVANEFKAAKFWILVMALAGFILSVLGSFLVRSGVLISVHTFAADPGRGSALLLILMLLCLLSIGLMMRYKDTDQKPGGFLSRRLLLAYSAALMMTFVLFVVLLGTLYPLVMTSMGWGEVSVGSRYFSEILMPVIGLGLILMLFMDTKISFSRIILFLAGVSVLVLLYWPLGLNALIFMFLIIWAMVCQLTVKIPGSIRCAHVGIILILAGVLMHGELARSYEIAVGINQPYEQSDVKVHLVDIEQSHFDNLDQAAFTLMVQDHHSAFLLKPKRRYYASRDQVMNKSAVIHDGLTDIYAVMGESVGDGLWSLRLYFKPGVILIWLGAMLIAIGLCWRSYRVRA
jgi:cytochrome c-type biogenesis protein CcmF